MAFQLQTNSYTQDMSWREFKAWLEGYEAKGFGNDPAEWEIQEIKDRLNRVRVPVGMNSVSTSKGY